MNSGYLDNNLLANKNKKNYEKVWVLLDSKKGHKNQAIAVANKLKLKYKLIDIKYTALSVLPNFLLELLGGVFHVKKSIRKKLNDPFPKIIIACGRRTAPIAKWIKKTNQGNSFHAQIMWPGMGFFSNSNIDIIATPEHDRIFPRKNILYTQGVPHEINKNLLEKGKKDWNNQLKDLPSPRIAVLIGGNTKHGSFNSKMLKNLLEECIKMAEPNGSLMITSSRRTDEKLNKYMDNIIKKSGLKYFLWHDNKNYNEKKNPYIALLAYADFIVVTGDSISMLSEACSVAKPVYIFSTKSIYSKKHILFHKTLIKNKHASLLGKEISESFSFKTINDSDKVAKKIIEMIKN
mgnify:CR=1 FL=1